jgi:hypothetical protein
MISCDISALELQLEVANWDFKIAFQPSQGRKTIAHGTSRVDPIAA